MNSRKSHLLFTSLLALLLAVCCSLSAFAEEEDVSLTDLDLGEVEEVSIEAPLVSRPLPIDFTGGFAPQESGYQGDSSYRDPTPGKTLEVDRGTADFLRAFIRNGEDLDRYIISALNELNPLLSPRDKGTLADGRYMTGYTRDEAERIRKQILHAVPEDLERCAQSLEAFGREGTVCVVANKDALKDCEGLTVKDL